MRDLDVIVVGAGPTGLMLAGDLAAYGVSCALVERRADESNLTRAFAVHARTLELLDIRGVADELVGTGARVPNLRLVDNLVVDLSGLPTRFPYLLVTPQYETERVLEARAKEHGVTFLRGTELVGLRQDADGVEVDLRDATGASATRRASYVVGADGVHSTVRGGGWYRVIAWDRSRDLPDDAPVELDEVRTVVARVCGSDYGMAEASWLSRFHSDERQVPHYRVGRVFVAGDAAHVHSPAGGQGMNAGLQDVANLSWRLAAAVHGHAPEGLLDGYERERHPIGRAILRGSGALLRLVTSGAPPLRALRRLVGAAGRIGKAKALGPGLVSGIDIRYPRPPGAHRLTGRRVADVAVTTADGVRRRLYDVLRDGRFVLVTAPGADIDEPVGWSDRVTTVRAEGPTETTVLVRPDAYAAWASDVPTEEAVRVTLTEWCGPTERNNDVP